MKTILAVILAVFTPVSALAVTIDTVLIGNPNNTPDVQPQGLFGRVTTTYRIAETEVTNTQYAEFLNAVADADPYGLYHTDMSFSTKGGIDRSGVSGSYTYSVKPDVLVQEEGQPSYTYTYGDKPVVFVSWFDAVRFANWMHNGQGSGSTEAGAYTLVGGTPIPSNPDSIARNGAAKWFLPTENEWYKAAYYNSSSAAYFDFPTGSNTAPDNNLPESDTGNSANYLIGVDTTTGSLDYPNTAAGAYTMSESPYGTFDQGGSVWEWNQTLISSSMRGRRGGAWGTDAATLNASHQGSLTASFQNESTGFRLASVPDPGVLLGDFNNDGVVNAADYVVWRKTGGTVEQYNQWRTNFGMSSSGGGAVNISAIPEPTGAFGFLCAALTVLGYRRRAGR